MEDFFKNKYLKYKNKYIQLQKKITSNTTGGFTYSQINNKLSVESGLFVKLFGSEQFSSELANPTIFKQKYATLDPTLDPINATLYPNNALGLLRMVIALGINQQNIPNLDQKITNILKDYEAIYIIDLLNVAMKNSDINKLINKNKQKKCMYIICTRDNQRSFHLDEFCQDLQNPFFNTLQNDLLFIQTINPAKTAISNGSDDLLFWIISIAFAQVLNIPRERKAFGWTKFNGKCVEGTNFYTYDYTDNNCTNENKQILSVSNGNTVNPSLYLLTMDTQKIVDCSIKDSIGSPCKNLLTEIASPFDIYTIFSECDENNNGTKDIFLTQYINEIRIKLLKESYSTQTKTFFIKDKKHAILTKLLGKIHDRITEDVHIFDELLVNPSKLNINNWEEHLIIAAMEDPIGTVSSDSTSKHNQLEMILERIDNAIRIYEDAEAPISGTEPEPESEPESESESEPINPLLLQPQQTLFTDQPLLTQPTQPTKLDLPTKFNFDIKASSQSKSPNNPNNPNKLMKSSTPSSPPKEKTQWTTWTPSSPPKEKTQLTTWTPSNSHPLQQSTPLIPSSQPPLQQFSQNKIQKQSRIVSTPKRNKQADWDVSPTQPKDLRQLLQVLQDGKQKQSQIVSTPKRNKQADWDVLSTQPKDLRQLLQDGKQKQSRIVSTPKRNKQADWDPINLFRGGMPPKSKRTDSSTDSGTSSTELKMNSLKNVLEKQQPEYVKIFNKINNLLEDYQHFYLYFNNNFEIYKKYNMILQMLNKDYVNPSDPSNPFQINSLSQIPKFVFDDNTPYSNFIVIVRIIQNLYFGKKRIFLPRMINTYRL
jgi:hypothetical protein